MTLAESAAVRTKAIDTAAVVIMVGLTFSWGLNGVAAKVANAGYSPVLLSVLRSLIGAACVFLWCRWRGVPLFDRDGTLWAGVAAGILFGAEFVLIYIGLDYTSVARSALMVNTMPFWVLLGAHFLLGERISGQKLVGIILAFGGVALVFSDRLSLPDADALMGDLMSLAGGALWAATTLVIKGSRLVKASGEKVLLYQLAVSALVALPLLPLGAPLVREPSALAIGALLFQAIFIVGFTYVVWFGIMRRYPAAGLSSFTFLTPAFGVLLGGMLLDEPLSIQIFLALGMIAAGLVLVNRGPKLQAS